MSLLLTGRLTDVAVTRPLAHEGHVIVTQARTIHGYGP